MNIRTLLSNYIRNNAVNKSEYADVANSALKKMGINKYLIFNQGDKLVMIDMSSSNRNIATGIELDDTKKIIVNFSNSEDAKSVLTGAFARYAIMQTITSESDILRLKALSKFSINWIIHYVTDDKTFPEHICDAHTHGLGVYGHLDLQTTLDTGKKNVAFLLNAVAERVRDGEHFSHGDKVKGIYSDCEIKFAETTAGGHKVLRILIPDMNNRFPGEPGCELPYSEQEKLFDETPK